MTIRQGGREGQELEESKDEVLRGPCTGRRKPLRSDSPNASPGRSPARWRLFDFGRLRPDLHLRDLKEDKYPFGLGGWGSRLRDPGARPTVVAGSRTRATPREWLDRGGSRGVAETAEGGEDSSDPP